ncbi:hypothetical protein WMY93_006357 [Mugilogobius chulae]|uniref:Paralemmin n=1 Tax=Mugilogobius chulae TaxID=88201 RepID=A0AAW0PJP5_9GOBI
MSDFLFFLACRTISTSKRKQTGARMDEAEKYKQRLEAIAEKRRLVEEQERAKRDMEDERIRLQQLKRKSLRDQWLMEGPPLSPNSLDAPRSPLWGTQAQEMEKRIEKLESQTQQLAEAEEKITEQMQLGQTKTVEVEETATEIVQNVVHNGKNGAESGEEIQAVTLTNGAGGKEEDMDCVTSVLPSSNGLSEEIKYGQVVNLNNNNIVGDEEEEGTMVIRAECVMITDEGDDAAEDNAKENCGENVTSPSEEIKKTVSVSGQMEEMVVTTVEVGLPENAMIPNGVEEDHLEEKTAAQLESQEDTVVASVPVYPETQPSITTSLVEAENEDNNKEETIEVSPKPKGNVKVEFQEVPLSEPQDKKTPGEQDALLSEVKGHATNTEKAGTTNQTESPSRDQAETKMPKRKTCQCCSVM